MKNRKTFVRLPHTHVEGGRKRRTLRTICLLLFLSVSFAVYSQITVSVKDLSLRASLKKIEQVSNYKFFYNESLPELNQKVSLNVKDATIEQTMQQLLGKMELTYKKELGWNVWDYSSMPLNLYGQICLPFSGLWFLLCIPAFGICSIAAKRFRLPA